MALFTSEYTFKVDRKGRVSVPADYRVSLQGESFQGIVVIPGWEVLALDGYANSRIDEMADGLDEPGLYEEGELEQAQLFFATAKRLPLDGDGRILLPEDCLAHAKISDQVVYAGLGRHFRIWQPEAYADYKASVLRKTDGRPPRLKVPTRRERPQ